MDPSEAEPVRLRRPSRKVAAILAVPVILAGGVGGWSIWKAQSQNDVQPVARETVVRRIVVRQEPDSAAEQNLAAQPDFSPLDAPIRAAVGPSLTDDELSELEVAINLIFLSGETSTQAVEGLIQKGMAPDVARKVIQGTWPLIK